MSRFEHIAWYAAISANIWAAADNEKGLWIFVVVGVVAIVLSVFERKP